MTYSWVACAATTGAVITELPDLDIPSVGVTLCDWWSGQGSLPLDDKTPAEWRRATAPQATYLVLLDDEIPDPIWGGIVTGRQMTGSDSVTLNVACWESYLARRYVHDLTYPDVEQCGLAADLVTQCVLTVSDATPTPPALIVEYTAGTTTRYREYQLASSKSVAAALQELSGVEGGPEWTVTWRHLTGPERYVPVLKIADRIGVPKPAGMPSSQAQFQMPGCVAEFTLTEDWTDGKAANAITATSTDEDSNTLAAVKVFTDPDRPTIEYRYTSSSSITDIDTLRAHAAQALSIMKDGAVALSLAAAVDGAPRLGIDWGLGDDIGWSLACRSVSPGRMIPGDDGSAWIPVEGVDRCVGWEASLSGVQTVTPILATREKF